MSKAYENKIVGYNTDCNSITYEDLKKRVTAASKRVKSGDFITQKSIEKEIENRKCKRPHIDWDK